MKNLSNYSSPIQFCFYTLLVFTIFDCKRKETFGSNQDYYVLFIVPPNSDSGSIEAYKDSAHTLLFSATALDSLKCGEKIYLKAIPTTGNIVVAWNGVDAGSENPNKTTAVVTMNSNKEISVSFGIYVTLSLNQKNTNIELGLTDTLQAIAVPNKPLNWSTQNPTIATVDNNGIVTAKGTGTTKIIVTPTIGIGADTCTVNVVLWDGNTQTPVIAVNNTYFINAASQLAWIADQNNNGISFANKTIFLNNNINLNNKLWTPIGGDDHALSFLGFFDGNNKTISNLYVNYAGSGGLFTYITNATIQNLTLANVNITAERNVGALVGHVIDGSLFKNCTIQGGTITTTSLDDNVGGLVGLLENGSVISCNSSTTVTVQAGTKNTTAAGGLIGGNDGASIVASYATGNVTGDGYYVGGLVGFNYGNIIACKSTSSLEVGYGGSGGGLVGETGNSTIVSSYATGNVSGDVGKGGGLVGRNYSSSTITCSYATGKVTTSETTTTYLGSIIGYNKGNLNYMASTSTSSLLPVGYNSGSTTNQVTSDVTDVYSFIVNTINTTTADYEGHTVFVYSLWSNNYWNANLCPKLIWE